MLVTVDAGTVVTFFLNCEMDLFFLVAVLSSGGNVSADRDRRVLTFPSGFAGRVSRGFDGGLRFAVPVGRWEDAEGDRDTSFKVQVDDFCWRERIFSYNLP